jgi:hypothetical protein
MKRRELPTGFRNLGLGILDGGKNVARPQVIGLAFVPEGPIMALWRQEYHPEWSIRGFGP